MAQSRLALTQAERIATLEAELAASREDAKLAWAEAAMGPTEAAITHELAKLQAHANALRDALEKFRWAAAPEQHGGTSAYPYEEIVDLLAQTPAASLAAHDAEVLERAAEIAEEHARPEPTMSGKTVYGNPSALKIARDIRALAAQAATHSHRSDVFPNDGQPKEVKP